MKPGSRLFEPIRVGGITLANRIAVSPMCQYSAEDGSATDWHLQHLGSLSLSGAGVLSHPTKITSGGSILHEGYAAGPNKAGVAPLRAHTRSKHFPNTHNHRNRPRPQLGGGLGPNDRIGHARDAPALHAPICGRR